MTKAETKHNACFPAGTRVMTDKGLVPIESIKVGDKVLSKPEDNTGEAEFKPVLKKFVHDNKELWTLTYVEIPSNMDRNKLTTDKLKRLSRKGKFITIEATPNHPFWVEGEGWTRLDHLQYGHIIQSKKDGMVCMVFNVSPMFQTNIDKIAVLYSIRNILDADKKGEDIDDVTYYDFAKYGDDGYVAEFLNDGYDSPSPLNVEGYPPIEVSTETYRTTVYNFEVADHHTYYVWDLWVHNDNCPTPTDADVKRRQDNGTPPIQNVRIFHSKELANEYFRQNPTTTEIAIVKVGTARISKTTNRKVRIMHHFKPNFLEIEILSKLGIENPYRDDEY